MRPPMSELDSTQTGAQPVCVVAEETRCRLRAVYPPGVELQLDLGPDRVVLGRAAAPGVVLLDHPTVSRQHLAIEWDAGAGRHAAVELGSRNGSAVGGAPLPAGGHVSGE